MRARRTIGLAAALTLSALVLAGCGGSDGSASAGAGSGEGAGAAASAEPAPEQSAQAPQESPDASQDGFPGCDEVKAALGPAVAALVELPDAENGVTDGSGGPSLTCTWHTAQTAEGSLDLENYGGIGVGISRDPEYTEDSMGTLGWNISDPRLGAVGAWALKVGGGYDPAAQLDALGVQVVRDGVVVVLTSGGAALQDVPELAALTNDWAVGAGVALLDLM